MPIYSISHSKTHLSRLVEKALNGEEIIIARAGKPVARISPIINDTSPRVFGLDKGKVKIAPDFDAPLPEFNQA